MGACFPVGAFVGRTARGLWLVLEFSCWAISESTRELSLADLLQGPPDYGS